jgi:C4-dicarboxylate-specific signal transduction histidine kinase
VASLWNGAQARLLRIADQIESGDPPSVAAAKIRGEIKSLQVSMARYTKLIAAEEQKPVECDIGDLLRNMAILNEDRFAAARARIIRPDNVHAQIRTYPADFKAALQEVLDNCADSLEETPNGTVEREVNITLERDYGTVQVTVRDNGQGFAPDAIDNMYKPEFTTRGKEHLGLGLYIARRMMNAIGGEIDARNRKDQSGAEVVLTLRDIGER